MDLKNSLKVMGLVLLTGLSSLAASAQSFQEGDNVLGLGVGLLGGYGPGLSGSGVSQSPAIALHFDHGMGDLGPGVWSLGGYVGYKSVGYKYDFGYYTYDRKYTYLVVAARGTWHYNDWHSNDKLDTYGGILLGYRGASFTDNTDYGAYGYLNPNYTYSGSGVAFGAFVGARYYVSDKFGFFGEVGTGIAVVQLGLSLKL